MEWWLVKLRLLLALAALAIGLVAAPLGAAPPKTARPELGDHAQPDAALVLRAQRPDQRARVERHQLGSRLPGSARLAPGRLARGTFLRTPYSNPQTQELTID
jgi:hypothetical protein